MDETKKKIKSLLDEELSRKEFLRKSGLAALTLVGIPAVLGSLMPNFAEQNDLPGYGLEDYGP